jgi:hypothetical protein
MIRMIQLASLACTLASGAVLTRPTPAAATLAPSPFGYRYCCETTDKSTACCFWSGCYVYNGGCFKLGS